MKLTENEKKMIENFITNDYGDGNDNYTIWSDTWDCGVHGQFCPVDSAPGIISSLVKKGLVISNGESMSLTNSGMEIKK